MKLFSWSSLFFVLSLGFLWGCGYWAWLQMNQSQQSQLQSQLALQLERTEVLMDDWQRNYRLHLDYLKTDLAALTPATTDNPIYDPWQELDDKVQHAPWPDPLLGYALLDDAGRAIRLSNAQAGVLFAQTAVDLNPQQPFLTPLVLASQWVAPVQLAQGNQYLLFWFDLSALKQRLNKALAAAAGHEFLLVSKAGQLLSPSRYQSTLLARLGQADLREGQQLKFLLKRPPEDLTQSRQKYDGSMAWPPTRLAQLLTSQRQGVTPLFVPNYLGRPSVASWRWSAGWQAHLVVEHDISSLQQQRKTLRQYMLGGLSVLTVMLLLLFWLIQRGVAKSSEEAAATTPPISEPAPVVITESVIEPAPVHADGAMAQAAEPAVVAGSGVGSGHDKYLAAAGDLLQALLSTAAVPAALKDAGADWLQAVPVTPAGICVVQPVLLLRQLCQKLQAQYHQTEFLLDVAPDVPLWLEVEHQALLQALDWVARQRLSRPDVTELMVRLQLAEPERIAVEVIDDGEPISASQWPELSRHGNSQPMALQKLTTAGGTFSPAAVPPFSGNKMILTLAVHPLEGPDLHPDWHLTDGAALLLCPAGDAQQLYRRMLRQSGLALMPLDDAAQFMQWCSQQSTAQLDYLLLDEAFIKADLAVAAQVFTVVRRYFPALTLVVLVREPEVWQTLQQQFGLRLVGKPVLAQSLQHALVSQTAAVFQGASPQLWLQAPQPLENWQLRQLMQQLGYQVNSWQPEMPLPGDAILLLPLELQARWPADSHQRVLWYTDEPVAVTDIAQSQDVWTFAQGVAGLSQRLFQLSIKNLPA